MSKPQDSDGASRSWICDPDHPAGSKDSITMTPGAGGRRTTVTIATDAAIMAKDKLALDYHTANAETHKAREQAAALLDEFERIDAELAALEDGTVILDAADAVRLWTAHVNKAGQWSNEDVPNLYVRRSNQVRDAIAQDAPDFALGIDDAIDDAQELDDSGPETDA